jgi:class 3 adenylate cyclase
VERYGGTIEKFIGDAVMAGAGASDRLLSLNDETPALTPALSSEEV